MYEQIPRDIDDICQGLDNVVNSTGLSKPYILWHIAFISGSDSLTTFSLEHISNWKWEGNYNTKWMTGDRDQFWGSLRSWRLTPVLLVYEHLKLTQPDRFKFYNQKQAEDYMQSLYDPSNEDEESVRLAKQMQEEFDKQ